MPDETDCARTRAWVAEAVRRVRADTQRSADTHLRIFDLPAAWGIDLYLKDESVHPTGSLKHRLARSLFLFALVNGDISPDTTLVEASSGSTAVSEAYFARLLGLAFVAVVPRSTASAKVALIEHHGGRCHFVDDAADLYAEAERLGAQENWFYLDQFSMASTVTDWRGNNNIAYSIFEQLALERFPTPEWIVVGAGTGGTSATIGRYCRYRGVATQVAVADPEGSVFADAWRTGRRDLTAPGSRIEGIGRGRVEPSFVPAVIDDVYTVSDAESIAAMRLLHERMGVRAGASTGTNLVAALRIVARMRRDGTRGSVVTLICDDGHRYLDTYYDDEWVAAHAMSSDSARAYLDQFLDGGDLDAPASIDQDLQAWLGALRPDVRTHTIAVDTLIITGDDPGPLDRVDRLRIALRVALVTRSARLCERFTTLLEDAGHTADPAIVAHPEGWQHLGPAAAALLAHADQMALDPRDAGAEEIAILTNLGVTPATVVAASQVVAYVAYLARLLQGLAAVATESAPAETNLPPEAELPPFSRPLDPDARSFPMLRWEPYLDPAQTPDVRPGTDQRTPARWSPFYLTLLHEPEVLAERTALYNAIMTGSGSLDRADRELAALAASLVTGCEYCASVHGRRHIQLAKDSTTAVALAAAGPANLTDERQRAVVTLAARAAVTPPRIDATDIQRLRGAGLDDDDVRDAIAVAAMFSWANRLMMTLGRPDSAPVQ